MRRFAHRRRETGNKSGSFYRVHAHRDAPDLDALDFDLYGITLLPAGGRFRGIFTCRPASGLRKAPSSLLSSLKAAQCMLWPIHSRGKHY